MDQIDLLKRDKNVLMTELHRLRQAQQVSFNVQSRDTNTVGNSLR